MAFSPPPFTATAETLFYSIIMVVAGLVLASLALYCLRHRAIPSAKPFIVLLALSASWSFLSTAILITNDLSFKIRLQQMEYICIILIPVAALTTVIRHLYPSKPARLGWVLPLMAIPLMSILALFTNDYHHLFFTHNMMIDQNGASLLVNDYGPLFYLSSLYSYLLIIIAIALLMRNALVLEGIYRRRSLLIAVGIAVPFVGDAAFLMGYSTTKGISLAPVLLVIMGMTLLFALFRYHMFDITPVARSAVWENTPDPSIVLDDHHRIIDSNRAACELLRHELGKMMGKTIEDLAGPAPELLEFLKKKSPARADIVITRDDVRLSYDVQLLAMKDARNAPIGTLVFMRDITDRKELEEVLQQSERKYRTLLDNTPFPLAMVRIDDGSFFYLNSAMEQLLKGGSDQLLNAKVTDFLASPEDGKALLQRLRQEERVGEFETALKSSQGDRHWIYLTAMQVVFEQETFAMLVINDISDRKMAEALRAANKKLNLISNITRHDLMNKFMVMGGYIKLLEGVNDKSSQEKIMQKLETTSLVIQELINFARDYERLGVEAPVWQMVDVVFKRATAQLDLNEVKVECNVRQWQVFADTMLEKVFYNLMDNSLRHGGHVSHISLGYQEMDDGTLSLVYDDDGDGISLEDKKYLFQQGHGKNTGQGMFLTKEILQITGMTIREEGEPGKGVRFIISVPKGMYSMDGAKDD